MNLKVILCLILVLFVYKMYQCKEVEIKKLVTEKGKNVEKMFPLGNLKKLKLPKKIEVTNLEKVSPEIFLRYSNNNNYIYNDGRRIFQNCLKYLKNRAIIDGFRYGLSRLEWHKSILTWDGKEVGLELHVIHHLVEKDKTIVFVFPLSLVDIKMEYFVELSFNTQETDESTLISLITKVDQVPSYICCDPIAGPLINFNLCPVANVILQEKYFYKYEINEHVTWLISRPQPYSRYIGLNIRSKLVG
jgi:hypothetical protein